MNSIEYDEIENQILKHKIFLKNQRSNVSKLLKIPNVTIEPPKSEPVKGYKNIKIKKRPKFIFLGTTTKTSKAAANENSPDKFPVFSEIKPNSTRETVETIHSHATSASPEPTAHLDVSEMSKEFDAESEIIVDGLSKNEKQPEIDFTVKEDLETRLAEWIKREVLLKLIQNDGSSNSASSNVSIVSGPSDSFVPEKSDSKAPDEPIESLLELEKEPQVCKDFETDSNSSVEELRYESETKSEQNSVISEVSPEIPIVGDSNSSKDLTSSEKIPFYAAIEQPTNNPDTTFDVSAIEQPTNNPDTTFDVFNSNEIILDSPKDVSEAYKLLLNESEVDSYSVPTDTISSLKEPRSLQEPKEIHHIDKEIQTNSLMKQQSVQVSEWSSSGTTDSISEISKQQQNTDAEPPELKMQIPKVDSLSEFKGELSELDMQIHMNESMSELEPLSIRSNDHVKKPIKETTTPDNNINIELEISKSELNIEHSATKDGEQPSQYDADSAMVYIYKQILEVSSIDEITNSKSPDKKTSSNSSLKQVISTKKETDSSDTTKSLSITTTTISLSEGEVVGPLLSEGEVFRIPAVLIGDEIDASISTGWAITSKNKSEGQESTMDFSSSS